jgi:hypothetical protein
MPRTYLAAVLLAGSMLSPLAAFAGQAPAAAFAPDIPISHRDRVYAAEQFSSKLHHVRGHDLARCWKSSPTQV